MVRDPQKVSVFYANCGAQKTLDLIADKWAVLIIYALAHEILRYSELQRKIEGISQKMLTQTLRRLERDGLVQRIVYPVVPPRVEYCLTDLGRSLLDPLQALCQWAELHAAELEAIRNRTERV